jgi:hypothetical protein
VRACLLSPAHDDLRMCVTGILMRAYECVFVYARVSVLGLFTCACLHVHLQMLV